MLEKLTQEFLQIFDKCPSRLKKKIMQSHEAVSFDRTRFWYGILNNIVFRPKRRRKDVLARTLWLAPTILT